MNDVIELTENDLPSDSGSAKDTDGDQTQGAGNESKAPDRLSELLDHFVESTEGQDNIEIVDLLDSLSSRAHGPMLLLPAIIAISPIGMIPGMSVVTGTLVLLIASQMLLSSSRPWIPKRLQSFEFSRNKLKDGVSKMQPWVLWFEKVVKKRLQFLTTGAAIYPLALACVVLAITFYPLAFVPLGVLIPGFAVTLLALGLTAKDGVLVLAGYAFTVFAIATIWYAWPF